MGTPLRANKDRLVLAAIEQHRDAHPIAVPDTGDLRGDLLAYLTLAQARIRSIVDEIFLPLVHRHRAGA